MNPEPHDPHAQAAARRTLERALVRPTPQEVEAFRQKRLEAAREPHVVRCPGGGKVGVVPVHGPKQV